MVFMAPEPGNRELHSGPVLSGLQPPKMTGRSATVNSLPRSSNSQWPNPLQGRSND